MATCVQDYKHLIAARREYKKARTDLDTYYTSIVQRVDLGEFTFNVGLMKIFCELLPKDEGQPKFEEEFVAQYELYSPILRATTCFFKLHQPVYVGDIFEHVLSMKEVGRCINNKENGTINEKFCAGCPHFEELVKYQFLYGDMKRAKQKREDAKQQLFSHFWKQQTKGK